MPGADEIVTLEPPIGEPATVVRAAIIEGKGAAVTEDDDGNCLVALARGDYVAGRGGGDRLVDRRPSSAS